MPYLTVFVPESATPAIDAATPAALFLRCAAAGSLIQEAAALLYQEGVPFDHILFPYVDALLLTQSRPAFLGSVLRAKVSEKLTSRLPELFTAQFHPILPLQWEISSAWGQSPLQAGGLPGSDVGYTLYIREGAGLSFSPDGNLSSATGETALIEWRLSEWEARQTGPDWRVRAYARQFFSFCEVAARLGKKEGAVAVCAAHGKLCMLAPKECVETIRREIMKYAESISFPGTFLVVIRKRFVV